MVMDDFVCDDLFLVDNGHDRGCIQFWTNVFCPDKRYITPRGDFFNIKHFFTGWPTFSKNMCRINFKKRPARKIYFIFADKFPLSYGFSLGDPRGPSHHLPFPGFISILLGKGEKESKDFHTFFTCTDFIRDRAGPQTKSGKRGGYGQDGKVWHSPVGVYCPVKLSFADSNPG